MRDQTNGAGIRFERIPAPGALPGWHSSFWIHEIESIEDAPLDHPTDAFVGICIMGFHPDQMIRVRFAVSLPRDIIQKRLAKRREESDFVYDGDIMRRKGDLSGDGAYASKRR